MDFKELRIGNYVYDDMDNMVQIDHQDIGEELYIFYKPIELTEEILLKCPDISKKDGCPYKFLNGYLKLRNGVFFYKYYDLEIELPYLHTFENLVFELTNKELHISL